MLLKSKGKKKIVCVHLLNDFSGSPKVLSQSINALKNGGVDVELLTGGGGEGFLSDLVPQHHQFSYRRFNNKILTLFSYLFSQFSLFLSLLRYRNEDVLIYINTLLPFGAAFFGKLTGKEVIYHIHETSISPKPLKYFLRKVVALTASRIIFVSNSLMQQESFKFIEQQVIYNSLDDSFVKKAAEATYRSIKDDGSFKVLMVCSLKRYKGVDQFLQLAQLCLSESTIKFSLVLNASSEEVSSYFSKIKLPENVTIFTSQNDLHPFYTDASLLLNLSLVDQWVETFGLTILEAMAYGVPVIAPPIGGPTELVANNVNGYLVSAYDVQDLKDKILYLIDDISLCTRLSRAGRVRVKGFSEPRFTDSIIGFISENGC